MRLSNRHILALAGLSALLLSACTLEPPYRDTPAPEDSATGTDWSVRTGSVMTGSTMTGASVPVSTGSTMTGSSLEDADRATAGTGDVTMDISDGTASLVIDTETGATSRVTLEVERPVMLNLRLTTPDDPAGNIRISQIVMPDGTADGPFGTELNYRLSQTGSYRLILSANQMAGDPWGGRVWLQAEAR